MTMPRKRILVVEDVAVLAITFAALIEKAGHEAVIADTAESADLALVQNPAFDAILLDLQLPDADGLAWLRANPDVIENYPVIVATGDASLSRAIEAMRLGAFDFLVKPVAGTRLVAVIRSALELGKSAPRQADTKPLANRTTPRRPGTFIGSSPAMKEVYRQIECVARSMATVFITGESGTGKELCADAIHRSSGRSAAPFVAINCGAIPENLLESEIFGHLKGSFTGAVNDRIGAAQAAHKGTLFLDEICEMAMPLQVKLLRFLQSGTIQRVGSNRVEGVDVRIICATNRDPMREVEDGRFREDLFYRLAVVPLHMPPLRLRENDIRDLAEAFLTRFAREEGKVFSKLSSAQIAALERHTWPGNVRELQNVMRRAIVLNPGPELPITALPRSPTAFHALSSQPEFPSVSSDKAGSECKTHVAIATAIKGLTLGEIERIAFEAAIDSANGSLPSAARALGVSPSTLYRKRDRWQETAIAM
jgi:two-component system, repressor protein LuxO